MVISVKDAEVLYQPEQLINPRSALSDAVPVKKKTKHWYFPLQNYEAMAERMDY